MEPACNILVVEDDPTSRMLVVAQLSRLGCTVTSAGNGLEALELARKQDFDMILMDIMMPVMDGLEATHRIRCDGTVANGRNILIVALTAKAAPSDRQDAFNAGVDGYLVKPVTTETLRDTLSETSKWLIAQL